MSAESCLKSIAIPEHLVLPFKRSPRPITANEHYGDESSSASEHEVEQALGDEEQVDSYASPLFVKWY